MNKYPFKRYKDSPIIDWEATYTEMPPKVKEYLIATIGEKETKRLMYFMKNGNYIILTGPSCSAKTTIREILWAIGYPYVIDDAGIGRVVNTTTLSGDLKPRSNIFEELGIEPIH